MRTVKREGRFPRRTRCTLSWTVLGHVRAGHRARKERRFGSGSKTPTRCEIDAAPTFYAVATSAPGRRSSHVEDLRHTVSIPRAIRSVGLGVTEGEEFVEALMRIRAREDRYQLRMGAVEVRESTLFRASIALPANLTEGDYVARFFLTRNGQVLDVYETEIDVRKVGLERFLYNLAHDQPLVYGLMSLAIAIAAGWGASAAFRLIRF